MWRVLGFCSSVLAVSFLYYVLYVRSHGKDLADFATLLLLFLVAQILAFWFLTSDIPSRTISITTNSGTLFLVFLGVFLNTHGIETLGLYGGQFLLLSPLGAMLLSVSSAAYKWSLTTQVIFVCAILQIGIGLFDVGEASNIRWMSAGAVLAVFAALGCAAYWAKDWNKSSGSDNGGSRALHFTELSIYFSLTAYGSATLALLSKISSSIPGISNTA
jgi:uncharacterized membrane protein